VGVVVNSKCWQLENRDGAPSRPENEFTQCCFVIRTDSTVREYHIDEKRPFVFVGEEVNPLLKIVIR
jgi:hypothetical protein